MLTTWALLLAMIYLNYMAAALLAAVERNPFADRDSQAFEKLVQKIERGDADMKPDVIANLFMSEHKVAMGREKLLSHVREIFQFSAFSIFIALLMQLYFVMRLWGKITFGGTNK